MRTSPPTHRRGLLAGLLLLSGAVSGAVAIASGGGPAPALPAATATPAVRAATSATVGDDDDRGRDGGRRDVVHRR